MAVEKRIVPANTLTKTRSVEPRWLRGLRAQRRVLVGLMFRDALRRYGHSNLGFFWVIGEPFLLTTGVMLMWAMTHMTHGSNVGVVPFALTGYSFLTLWRHISARSVRIMNNNASIAYHRQVAPLDTVFAMMAMESIGIFAAFLLSYIPFWLLGVCPPMRDPLVLIGGFFLSSWFAASFGLIVAGLAELGHLVEHVIPPMLYLTLPFTGAFTMVEWLPQHYQGVLLWSPLVNGIEMFRSGLFPLDVPTHWSATYLLVWCLAQTSVGLPLCLYVRRFMETSG